MIVESKAKPIRERVARHRKKEKEKAIQTALAISRIVLGKDPGDAVRALSDFLLKQSKLEEMPEDYKEIMGDAAEQLKRRRRY